MKKTLKSRILAGIMAGILALSLAVPAFAEENTPTTPSNQTVIDGSYNQPEIDVVVPKTGEVFINPYGLGATATKSDGSTVALSGQVMSTPLSIKNRTNMWLSVGAQVSAELPADATMKLAAATVEGVDTDNPKSPNYVAAATGKSAFVQLEVVQAPASVKGDETTEANTKTLSDKIIDASADSATWANSGKVTVSTKGAEGTELAVLKPATITGTGESATVTYNAGSIALFRLSGDCTAGSAKAPWTEDDTFTVNVIFNFAPAEAPSHAISYSLTGATTPTTVSAKEGETVTITITGTTGNTYDANTTGCSVTCGGEAVAGVTVKDADNVANNATQTSTGIVVSFTMPAGDVTITTSFSE